MAGTSLVTLEQLPDDVVATVMQYVAVRDVLACRLVSKRFCALALNRDVWRHRMLYDEASCAGTVLRLAPCLDTLKLRGGVATREATTTGCAVRQLILHGFCFNPTEYALVVRNQESLGRLRSVDLWVSHSLTPELDVLYRTVASCSGLTSLRVHLIPPKITVVRVPPHSSLTAFICAVNEDSASFLNTILAAHSATLEEVGIQADSDLQDSATADLLASMPRLRRLQCDSRLHGLEAVAKCKTLRDVSIHLCESLLGDDFDRVAKFLGRAHQLRRVYLASFEGDVVAQRMVEAVEALARSGRSGRSRVESLALNGFKAMPPLVRALGALPSLTTLRHLDMDLEPDDQLLKSITPITAPALRLLEIVADWGKCPHAWMHGAAVKATLAANPLLHIQLWRRFDDWDMSDHQDCETCAQGCHQGVNWRGVEKIGFYSHDPGTCPSPEAHTDVTGWLRSHVLPSVVACTWVHM